jgi:WD40 repeat protein
MLATTDGSVILLRDVVNGKTRRLENDADGKTGIPLAETIAFSPDETLVAAGNDSTLAVWNLQTGQSQYYRGHGSRIRHVVFSPNGKLVASAGDDGTIRIWDVQSGITRILQRHEFYVTEVAFSPDGQLLVSASADKTVRLWKADSNANIMASPQEFARWLVSLTSVTTTDGHDS